jgi:sugar phosphate isomerase/epimerase
MRKEAGEKQKALKPKPVRRTRMNDVFDKWSRRGFLKQAVVGSASIVPILNSSSHLKGNTASDQKQAVPVCVFSKHLQWLGYEEMGEAAAEMGFDGVALTVRPRGHVLPERCEDDLPRAVEAVRRAGIEVPMLTTAITDAEDVDSKSILRLAGELGIHHYRMGYYSYKDAPDIRARLDQLKPQVKQLADLNHRFGLFGGYQNHAGEQYVGAPVWDVWELIRDLDPNWIGCQFDIRHATVDGATAWPVTFRLVAPYTRMLAIKDFRWKKVNGDWQSENCPLGEGVVDFPKFIKLLKEHDFAGPISVHYEYPLGGANHGASKLEMDRKEFFTALKRDLKTLRSWLKAGELLNG